MNTAVIFGVTGQSGSYLAELLLSKGYYVYGVTRRSSTSNTQRIDHITDPNFDLRIGDVTDPAAIRSVLAEARRDDAVGPVEVYNLAAQSHVAVSFEQPTTTTNIDYLGCLNILEVIRSLHPRDFKFYQASSSEMFGSEVLRDPNTRECYQDEDTPMRPNSPYAIAKLAAHHLCRVYRDSYGIFACSGILFNHECVTHDTPVVVRRRGLIDVVAIGDIVPHRTDPASGRKYTTEPLPYSLQVWDRKAFVDVTCMTATWNDGTKEVVSINARGCYYEATSDHISFLSDEKEAKTGDIVASDSLTLGTLPGVQGVTTLSAEEAEFLGMMTACGYVSEDGNQARFTKRDDTLRSRASDLWQSITGGYTTDTVAPSGFGANDVPSVVFNGVPRCVKERMRTELYTENAFKKVPKRVLNASTHLVEAYLRGYNSCDGLKGGHQLSEFQSFTTNSQVLAAGLWYLFSSHLRLRLTSHPELRDGTTYFHVNINVPNAKKGQHLRKPLEEVKSVRRSQEPGWLFDLATSSGTFSAGIGLGWIHNSPRRGEHFVTRKITKWIGTFAKECLSGRVSRQGYPKLQLGNLDARRDWGHAADYVRGMWMMMQQPKPDDYVLATGKAHTVREFVVAAFNVIGVGEAEALSWVHINEAFKRPCEVPFLRGDASKARKVLGWAPEFSFNRLVGDMVEGDMR